MKTYKELFTKEQRKAIKAAADWEGKSVDEWIFEALKSHVCVILEDTEGKAGEYGNLSSYDFIFDGGEPPGPARKVPEPDPRFLEYVIKTVAFENVIKKYCGRLERKGLLEVRAHIEKLLAEWDVPL